MSSTTRAAAVDLKTAWWCFTRRRRCWRRPRLHQELYAAPDVLSNRELAPGNRASQVANFYPRSRTPSTKGSIPFGDRNAWHTAPPFHPTSLTEEKTTSELKSSTPSPRSWSLCSDPPPSLVSGISSLTPGQALPQNSFTNRKRTHLGQSRVWQLTPTATSWNDRGPRIGCWSSLTTSKNLRGPRTGSGPASQGCRRRRRNWTWEVFRSQLFDCWMNWRAHPTGP